MAAMIIEGNAWRYGRNVDTDVIIPARFLSLTDPIELGAHCLEDLDPEFINRVKAGDIVVAEDNFGSGSSREHAPLALKGCGVSLVIASSYARIFHRNAINVGLPILESPEAVEGIKSGDHLRVDLSEGTIENLSTGKTFQSTPFPSFMREIISHNGLVEYVKKRLHSKKGSED